LLATSLCGCGDSSNAGSSIGTISTVAGTGTYG
jgi:CDGSH-type Zn-finger protein